MQVRKELLEWVRAFDIAANVTREKPEDIRDVC